MNIYEHFEGLGPVGPWREGWLLANSPFFPSVLPHCPFSIHMIDQYVSSCLVLCTSYSLAAPHFVRNARRVCWPQSLSPFACEAKRERGRSRHLPDLFGRSLAKNNQRHQRLSVSRASTSFVTHHRLGFWVVSENATRHTRRNYLKVRASRFRNLGTFVNGPVILNVTYINARWAIVSIMRRSKKMQEQWPLRFRTFMTWLPRVSSAMKLFFGDNEDFEPLDVQAFWGSTSTPRISKRTMMQSNCHANTFFIDNAPETLQNVMALTRLNLAQFTLVLWPRNA